MYVCIYIYIYICIHICIHSFDLRSGNIGDNSIEIEESRGGCPYSFEHNIQEW